MTAVMQSKGLALLSMSRCQQCLSLLRELHHKDTGSNPHLSVRADLKPLSPVDKSKVYDVCWQTMRRKEYKCRSDPEFNVPSFIDARKKCVSPCEDFEALDITHYRPQDMLNRHYMRTWDECVVKSRKRKVQCVALPPKFPRRQRKVTKSPCPVNLCVLGRLNLELTEPCKLMKPTSCPRFKMPNCCVEPRNPPKCVRPFRGGLCKKRKTKYPSFSECSHDPIPDAAPVECKCLIRPSLCDMWRHYRRRH